MNANATHAPAQPTPLAPTDAHPRRFLDRLEEHDRSLLANLILGQYRRGASSPRLALRAVLAELRQRRDEPLRATDWWAESPDDHRRRTEKAGRLAAALESYPDEAIDLAADYLAYERLPRAERERLRAARAEEGRRAWMAGQPPTDAQLRYLARLGHRGPAPASKAEASELIDRLVGATS